MQLNDTELFKQQCYINGQWTNAENSAVITVTNPATGETVGTVPSLGREEVARAITQADEAMREWKKLPVPERGKYLHKLHDLILEHLDDLAMILTVEQGKPLLQSQGEILQGITYLPWFAEEARRAYGDTIPSPKPGVRIVTIRQPIGVVAAITPWNFPFGMILRKAAPALAAGCTVLVKPASSTPFSALALAELVRRAGFPAGTFSVVTGKADVVGGEITSNPAVRKITFTGSTEVGKTLVAQGAATMKHASMELGGNAPFIVFPDADLDIAVACAARDKFRNTGQLCICPDRFLVHESVYPEFLQRFAAAAKTLKLGNGIDPGVDVGPMIDKTAQNNMLRLVEDAKAKGAKVLAGGGIPALGGLYFEPTVLADVTPDMAVWHEEIFGPIGAVMPFSDEEEAVRLANDTNYGLASYFFTNDLKRVIRVSEALEYGMVGINDATLANVEAPFGGVKDSGLGREGSHEGLEGYMETKYILLGALL
ncbi:NAD-dependent succinate-semialdehyde dehydrogenase [Desulfovibrio sp. OttesenSCG-928-O18]|nr:NAD-dependent succinate-semialdehyde dehydrogenase [Desulfovibrio sp. OttesenSCG-928-O18]